MSASAMRENARQRSEKAVNQRQYAQEISENAHQVSSCKFLTFNARLGGGCADLPWHWLIATKPFLAIKAMLGARMTRLEVMRERSGDAFAKRQIEGVNSFTDSRMARFA